MRHSSLIAGLVSVCLLSACTPVANAPSSPESPAGTQNTGNQNPDSSKTNPFPPLAQPQPGKPLQVADYFQDPGTGLKVADVSISGGTDADQDGALEYTTEAKVDLGAKGVHDVAIAEEDVPASSSERDVYTVTDMTDGSSFVFERSSDGRNALVRQGNLSVTVAILEDETVSIDGEPPVAVDASVQQLLDAGLDGKITPHAAAALYARLLRTPAQPAQAYRLQSGLDPAVWLLVLSQNFLFVLFQILAGRWGLH